VQETRGFVRPEQFRTARHVPLIRSLLPRVIRSLVLGVVLSGGAGSLAAQERPAEQVELGPIIRGVAFEGNKAYDDELLAVVIATTQSAFFARPWWLRWVGLGEKRHLDEIELRRDLLRLTAYYREGGYLEAKVDTILVRRPTEVWVTFRITEGPPVVVDTFQIEGLEGFPERDRRELLQDLPLERGDPFDRRAMLAAADTLLLRLRDLAHPSAQLFRGFSVDRARRRSTIQFAIDPGPAATVGTATITGLNEVDTSLVRRLLIAQPGQPFAQRDLYESQRLLYRTELFSYASVDVDSTQFAGGQTVVPIGVRIREGKFRRVRAAVGYGTNDCFRGGAAWTARNWLGGGRILEVSARASKIGVGDPADWGLENSVCPELQHDPIGSSLLNYNTTVSVRRPAFFSPFNTSTGALFAERRSEWQVYLREEQGGSFSVRRETPKRIPVTGTYRLAWGKTTAPAITFCAYFNACTTEDIEALRERRRLATLAALVTIPRANDLLDPSRGYNLSFEWAWSDRIIGSDPLTEFTRLQGDASWYRPLSRNTVLAWRIRGGVLWSPPATFDSGTVSFVPPDQRFYVGGPNDVRGYDRNELGPVVYTVPDELVSGGEVTDSSRVERFPSGGNTFGVGNIELRVPSPVWSSRVRFAFFVDAGVLWQRDQADLAPPVVRVTPGAGIRIATPLGPARVDVGYNPYDRTSGPLYQVDDAGELTLVKDSFSSPRSRRYSLHISVGQPF
jgi:outer membrane protein insertion porin family